MYTFLLINKDLKKLFFTLQSGKKGGLSNVAKFFCQALSSNQFKPGHILFFYQTKLIASLLFRRMAAFDLSDLTPMLLEKVITKVRSISVFYPLKYF